MDSIITHDTKQKRFFCTVNNLECFVAYEPKGSDNKTIDIYKTFVHPDLRGQKIAEALLKSISEYAISKNISVIPSCSYAVIYYKRHPDYAVVLDKSVDLENGGSCRI
jgi:predicted GNAT family acetyltransferase